MSILTFEEFQASKRHVDDIAAAVGFCDDQGVRGGHIYELGCYIEDHAEGHFLLLERSDWIDRDLTKLERILYAQWYVPEARAEERQKAAEQFEWRQTHVCDRAAQALGEQESGDEWTLFDGDHDSRITVTDDRDLGLGFSVALYSGEGASLMMEDLGHFPTLKAAKWHAAAIYQEV